MAEGGQAKRTPGLHGQLEMEILGTVFDIHESHTTGLHSTSRLSGTWRLGEDSNRQVFSIHILGCEAVAKH
jgi:hypothetical protein